MSRCVAERLEQALQLLDVRKLLEAHEIRLAGDHELRSRLASGKTLLRHLDRFDHQRVHRRASPLQLAEQQLPHLRQAAPAEAAR